jgi:hypothetical protein
MGTEVVEIKNPRRLENYEYMIGDLRAIVVETETVARMSLIEGYHKLGLQIVEFGLDKQEYLTQVSQDIQKSKRSIYRILQFVRMYPNLEDLPEGKNTSWHQICNKYLIGKSDSEPEPVAVGYDDLVCFIYENSNLLADKALYTLSGVTIRITRDQLEKYVESRNE